MKVERIIVAMALVLAALAALGPTPAMAWTAGGHRGATGVPGYPEQSLKALQYAKQYGATVAEGDVKFTQDDYAVMLHDTTLDRTTDCTGPVSAVTFAELRTCAPGTVVPQLLFWVRETKTLGLVATIEVPRGMTAHQVEVLRRTVVAEAPSDVVIAAWYPESLDNAEAALGTRAKYAPIIGPTGSPFGYSVADHAAKYEIILPDFHSLIVARVRWYHEAGVEVWGWTAKNSEDVVRMKALKLDVIIANDVRMVTEPLSACPKTGSILAGLKTKPLRGGLRPASTRHGASSARSSSSSTANSLRERRISRYHAVSLSSAGRVGRRPSPGLALAWAHCAGQAPEPVPGRPGSRSAGGVVRPVRGCAPR